MNAINNIPDCVPLTGTEANKPVTGDILVSDNKGLLSSTGKKIGFDDNGNPINMFVDLGENPNIDDLEDGAYKYTTNIISLGKTAFNSYQLFQTHLIKNPTEIICQLRFGHSGIYQRSLSLYGPLEEWSEWEETGANSIPLSGTKYDKPVTGDIEIAKGRKIISSTPDSGELKFDETSNRILYNEYELLNERDKFELPILNVSLDDGDFWYPNKDYARTHVPAVMRFGGKIITYRLNSGEWILEQFTGDNYLNEEDWRNDLNWKNFSEGGVNPSTPNSVRIRFISPIETESGNDEYVLKTMYVPKGYSVKQTDFPEHVENEYLIPDGWTHNVSELTNIQHDYDIGALYKTVGGKTYIFGRTTNATGAVHHIHVEITGSAVFRFSFSDGTHQDIGSSWELNFQPPLNADYMYTVERISGSGSLTFGYNNNSFITNPEERNTVTDLYTGNNIYGFGINAFNGFLSLKNAVFSKQDCHFGTGMFQNCVSLRSLILPDNVSSRLANTEFKNCYALKYVVLSDTVEAIGTSTFEHCSALTDMVLPGNLTVIADSAFRYCNSLNNVIIKEGVGSISNYAFSGCTSLSYIYLPSTVKTLGTYAFSGCTSLPYIDVSNVTSLGNYCFNGCNSLYKAVLRKNLAGNVPTNLFTNCYALRDVDISEAAANINAQAFDSCYSLRAIEIPASVTSISTNSFKDCSGILEYVFTRSMPPTITATTFLNMNPLCKIYVPDANINAYKTASNWNLLEYHIYPLSQRQAA